VGHLKALDIFVTGLDSFKLYSDYESTWKYCRWLWVERFLNHWLVVTW